MCPFSPTKSPRDACHEDKKRPVTQRDARYRASRWEARRGGLCARRELSSVRIVCICKMQIPREEDNARNDPLAFTGSPQIHALQASRLVRLPWNFSSVRSKQLQLSARGRFVACVKIILNVEKKTHTNSKAKSGRYVMENNRLHASWKSCIDSTYCPNRDEIYATLGTSRMEKYGIGSYRELFKENAGKVPTK